MPPIGPKRAIFFIISIAILSITIIVFDFEIFGPIIKSNNVDFNKIMKQQSILDETTRNKTNVQINGYDPSSLADTGEEVNNNETNETSEIVGDNLSSSDENNQEDKISQDADTVEENNSNETNETNEMVGDNLSSSHEHNQEDKIGQDEGTVEENNSNETNEIMDNDISSSHEHNEKDRELSLDLVVYLRGQTANELLKIAQGHVIKSLASKLDPPIHLNLRYRVKIQKSRYARLEIEHCFTNFGPGKGVNLSEFENDEDEEMWANQTSIIQNVMQDDLSEVFHVTGAHNESSIATKLKHIRAVASQMANENKVIESTEPSNPILSTPFLRSNDMFNIYSSQMLDKYYEEFRELFTFNEEECCFDVPDADDTVFHVRGFKSELPQRPSTWDAWPEIAYEKLISELREGDKVLILPGKEMVVNVTEYKEEFDKGGIQTRSSKNKGGIYDFCQLLKAKKEVIGNYFSTFFMWGAIFGTAEKVVIYSRFSRAKSPFLPDYSSYDFTHPFLKSRNLTTLTLQGHIIGDD